MRNKIYCIGMAVVLLQIVGCTTVHPPPGELPKANETPSFTKGSWVELTDSDDITKRGELIYISDDSVYLFNYAKLTAVDKDDIKSLNLVFYDSQYQNVSAWTVVGSLSTLSHGVLLLGSLPLWIISGSVSTSSQYRGSVRSFPKQSWEELTQYARFPFKLDNLSILKTLKQ